MKNPILRDTDTHINLLLQQIQELYMRPITFIFHFLDKENRHLS